MASLSIPEPIRKTLAQIASLNENQVKELLDSLRATAPAVYRADVISSVIQRVQSLPPSAIEEIVEALFGLSVGQFGSEVSMLEFVEDVAGVLPESEGEKRELFKQRLKDLLDAGCLRVGAKAYDLIFEHEHNYLSARVLTDLRPVFGESPDAAPIGAMIVHTLKINYVQASQHQTFFVALDARDIKKLTETLERAKSKASSLKTMLASTNVPYVGID